MFNESNFEIGVQIYNAFSFDLESLFFLAYFLQIQ